MPASGKAYPDLSGEFGIKQVGDPPHSCVAHRFTERLGSSAITADQGRQKHVKNVLT
jgi:hypothetical protein